MEKTASQNASPREVNHHNIKMVIERSAIVFIGVSPQYYRQQLSPSVAISAETSPSDELEPIIIHEDVINDLRGATLKSGTAVIIISQFRIISSLMTFRTYAPWVARSGRGKGLSISLPWKT
jgi:hypothetical protein